MRWKPHADSEGNALTGALYGWFDDSLTELVINDRGVCGCDREVEKRRARNRTLYRD